MWQPFMTYFLGFLFTPLSGLYFISQLKEGLKLTGDEQFSTSRTVWTDRLLILVEVNHLSLDQKAVTKKAEVLLRIYLDGAVDCVECIPIAIEDEFILIFSWY